MLVCNETTFASQQQLAVVWDDENKQKNWYVGLFLHENDDDQFGLIIYNIFQKVMIATGNNHN